MTNKDKSWADRAKDGNSGNKPTPIYDNGHGTRLKLWTNTGNGDYETAKIETGYYDDKQQWVKQTISLNKSEFLALSRALDNAHNITVDRNEINITFWWTI